MFGLVFCILGLFGNGGNLVLGSGDGTYGKAGLLLVVLVWREVLVTGCVFYVNFLWSMKIVNWFVYKCELWEYDLG